MHGAVVVGFCVYSCSAEERVQLSSKPRRGQQPDRHLLRRESSVAPSSSRKQRCLLPSPIAVVSGSVQYGTIFTLLSRPLVFPQGVPLSSVSCHRSFHPSRFSTSDCSSPIAVPLPNAGARLMRVRGAYPRGSAWLEYGLDLFTHVKDAFLEVDPLYPDLY